MLTKSFSQISQLNRSSKLLMNSQVRSFAIEDRSSKIECSTVYSEINCSGTYNDWEEFENYRKLVPFPKYSAQAQKYKQSRFEKRSLKDMKLVFSEKQKAQEKMDQKNAQTLKSPAFFLKICFGFFVFGGFAKYTMDTREHKHDENRGH